MTARGPFDVWAPRAQRLRLSVAGATVDMHETDGGWWTPSEPTPDPAKGDVDYGYLIDDSDAPRPDPRSRRQPAGVHQRSRTHRSEAFAWTDDSWTGRPLAGAVVYELHIGTFTPEGTFDAALGRLDHLRSIGVDFVEVMPVNAVNGTHNWGYDGVLWSAVHEPYGGPDGYQRFVDGCHAAGLGVVQDVVYNHLGPSGNYLPEFGPYLKQGRNTWGDLVNLDGEGSAEVRRLHPRQRADVARRLPRRRAAAGRRARAARRVGAAPARGDGDRGRGDVGAPAPPADADRGVRPQRPAPGHPARGRRLRPGRPVERRLPPRGARGAHRRDHRLLRGLRAAGRAGQGVRARVLPRRHLQLVPRP